MKKAALAALAAGLAGGCGAVFGSDDTPEVMAEIAYYGQPPIIRLPATVRSGRWFPVTVVVFTPCRGAGDEEGRTDISIYGLTIEITPYRRVLNPVNCPDVSRAKEQTARVRFLHRGTGKVIVVGQNMLGDTIRAERSIVVR